MSQYTAEEFDKIKTFRAKLKDLKLDADKNSSAYLIRWLRARDMNIPKAEEMIRNYMKWRKDENIDNILDWTPPEALINLKCLMFEESGIDNNGNPVFVVSVDLNKLNAFIDFGFDTLRKYFIYTLEGFEIAAIKQSRSNKKATRQVTGMTDLAGVEIRKLVNPRCIEFATEGIFLANNYYPELVNHIIITSTPRIFHFVFSLVKHFLPARTLEKIKVFGCNKDDWVEQLLKYIPEDQLSPTFCILN